MVRANPCALAAICVLILCGLVRAQAGPAGDANPPPTFEQLQAQLKAGDYPNVLRGVSRCLALKGEPAKAYDHYDLLMLRGEALVQTKALAGASAAFAAAQKASDDEKKKGEARALELLVQKSTPAGYVPHTAPKSDAASALQPGTDAPIVVGRPIPITDKSGRHLAFTALFNDELARVEPRCAAASRQDSIPPILEALRPLMDLHDIETAASGSDKRTHALSGDLTSHAHKLFSAALKQMSHREEAIWNSARKRNTRYNPDTGHREIDYGMKGPTANQIYELRNMVATCGKIKSASAELAATSQSSDVQSDVAEASRVGNRAQELLDYDYNNSGRYSKKPRQ